MAKPAQKILFFYCYQCRDYELKTSPHFRNQKRRFARRKKARKIAKASDRFASAPGSQAS